MAALLAARKAPPSPGFVMALLCSLLVHAILLFAISFKHGDPIAPVQSIAVTLLTEANRGRPDENYLLAQQDNLGTSTKQQQSSKVTATLSAIKKVNTRLVISPNGRFEVADKNWQGDHNAPHKQQYQVHDAAAKPQQDSTSDPNTKAYSRAAYVTHVINRVESIGTLNFPAEVKHIHFSRDPVLRMAINLDGSIKHLAVSRSSGVKKLDRIAENVVRQSAPFAPIPAARNKNTPLIIERAFHFSGSQVSTQMK